MDFIFTSCLSQFKCTYDEHYGPLSSFKVGQLAQSVAAKYFFAPVVAEPAGARSRWACTYREGNLTELLRPVVQLLPVCGKHEDLLGGLHQEGPRVPGTAVHVHLRHPDTVGQTDHLRKRGGGGGGVSETVFPASWFMVQKDKQPTYLLVFLLFA